VDKTKTATVGVPNLQSWLDDPHVGYAAVPSGYGIVGYVFNADRHITAPGDDALYAVARYALGPAPEQGSSVDDGHGHRWLVIFNEPTVDQATWRRFAYTCTHSGQGKPVGPKASTSIHGRWPVTLVNS